MGFSWAGGWEGGDVLQTVQDILQWRQALKCSRLLPRLMQAWSASNGSSVSQKAP